MKTIIIHRAKTNLSRLIEEASQGEEIIMAKGDKPKVRLVPITEPSGNRKPGRLKGKFKLGPEFFEPLPPEELHLWWQ